VPLAAGFHHTVVDHPRRLSHELDVFVLRHAVYRVAAVLRERVYVFVLLIHDGVEVKFVWFARETFVGACLIPVTSGGKHLLRRHTSPKDAETATGFAVVEQE
jgi:hypothetical protein